jgi:SAM-dependent methyltransferase
MLYGLARAVTTAFDLPGPVLEVGSFVVPGQEALGDLRRLFPGRDYLGIDMRPGPGVDQVADVEDLPFADGSMGTVICLSTFEHVRHFWRGFEEARRVLRPDGAMLVACPFYLHVHDYPSDYWRFTPEALKVLLADYPSKIIGWHGPDKRPANVWALAFREEGPTITPEQFRAYRELMAQHARMPLRWGRRLRYRLGRLLFGNRPFAPFLERETWQSECLNDPRPDDPHVRALRKRGRSSLPRAPR